MSRKGWTGGGGWDRGKRVGQGRWVGTPKGANSMAVSVLACEKPLVGAG